MSSDYERGYEQGLDDAHRCEKRHDLIGALEKENEAQRLEIEHLKVEVEQFRGIFGEHDAPPRNIKQAKMIWDALKDEAERLKRIGMTAEREVEQICGKALDYPWYGVCVGEHVAVTIVQELANRYVNLKAEVEHYRHACRSVGETDGHGWAETTNELRAELEQVKQDLYDQQWQHAACLNIAEGTINWNMPTSNDSLAMKTVRDLRTERDTLTQQLAACEEHQQLHDRIFARQKFLLDKNRKTITRLEGAIKEAVTRLERSSHSKEQPEPYESRAPIIRDYLQHALTKERP